MRFSVSKREENLTIQHYSASILRSVGEFLDLLIGCRVPKTPFWDNQNWRLSLPGLTSVNAL